MTPEVERARRERLRKFDSKALLAREIAHELSNSLCAMLNYSSIAMSRLPTESEASEAAESTHRGIQRLVGLCRDLRGSAGVRDESAVEAVDLSALVTANQPSLGAAAEDVPLSYELATPFPPVLADAALIGRAVESLVAGAAERHRASSWALAISIRTGSIDFDDALREELFIDCGIEEGRCVFVEVSDGAPTLEESEREALFDRFLAKGRHLRDEAVVVGAALAHKGAIRVDSPSETGNRIALFFTASSEAELLQRAAEASASPTAQPGS